MKILSCSIDLTKIDKTKIKDHSNGAKYYSITIMVNDEKDNFGNDISICTGQSKEERAAKVKQVYIGNGKTVYDKAPANSPVPAQNSQSNYNDNSDLPF